MTRIRDLRKRLELIKNLHQYTMALEIISATRLRKIRPQAEQAARFCDELKKVVQTMQRANFDLSPPLLVPRKTIERTALLVITADKGHCGVFNHMILKEADKILKSKSNTELFLVGEKAISHYQKKQWPIGLKVPKWTRKIDDTQIWNVVHTCEEAFLQGRVDQIDAVYCRFYGAVRKEITIETLYPLTVTSPDETVLESDPLFEPLPEAIYEKLLPCYSFSLIKRLLLTSHYWELTARSIAMQMATKNAENLTDSVTLLLNKTRQAEITKEALEIATSTAILSK